jgi:Mrp family chromosome partitioning ATPase
VPNTMGNPNRGEGVSYSASPTQTREEGAYAPILRAVRAHLRLVVGVAVLAVLTAVVFEASRAPKYEATAQVLVSPVSNNGGYAGLPAVVTDSSADPARTLQTATSVLESPVAASMTAHQLRGKWNQKSVSEAVNVQPRGESDIVSITGTAGKGPEAAVLANTYARSALALHASLLSREATSEINQLQSREKSLPAGESAAITQIAAQITTLSSVASGHDPNFSLLQAAQLPTSATGTSKKLILVLALLAGLVIGVGAATAIEYLNRRVRDEDELLSAYPLPVLARVPDLPRDSREIAAPELVPPSVREAFRTLQVQLPPAPLSGGRAIMFTSPSPGDGKTSSAINFALVLTAAKHRVILFDFDLRRPDVGRLLGVHAEFMDLFRTDGSLDNVLAEPRTAPGLRVIGSSPQADVMPLLEAVSRDLPELLRTARELADYVIIDTPPLGRVSDALRAAMTVDDVVLVARPGNTDRTDLQHTRELLDRMGHTPTGLLVVGEAVAGDAYMSYGAELPIDAVETNGRPPARPPASSRRVRAGGEPGGTPAERASRS